jgi:hypothetical protein
MAVTLQLSIPTSPSVKYTTTQSTQLKTPSASMSLSSCPTTSNQTQLTLTFPVSSTNWNCTSHIWSIWCSILVSQTLKGCHHLHGSVVKCKHTLMTANITHVLHSLNGSFSHDDLLFCAMLVTGFHALMRSGELTVPDKETYCSLANHYFIWFHTTHNQNQPLL